MNDLFNDVVTVWELRGTYPTIKHFEDIDIGELTHGDDDPMFLTLPIGEVNAISGNQNYYDEEWLQVLERQVSERRPIGIMGHLKPDDLSTAFPPEAIHWVGVQRVGEMLWGKGYVPPGEARERVRRYKATNKKLATSIFGEAKRVWDEVKKAYRVLADGFSLKQIDIGPADRVGIPSLATIPVITAEMQSNNNGETTMTDKVQIIREMTVEDAPLLPKAVREAVQAEVPTPAEVGLVAELRTALGVDEKANLTAVITEMKTANESRRKAEINGRITELVTDKERGVKVPQLQGLVTELISLRNPQTVAEVDTAYQVVVEMQQVKDALAAYVVGAMGPAQTTPILGQNGQRKYFNIPKKEAA